MLVVYETVFSNIHSCYNTLNNEYFTFQRQNSLLRRMVRVNYPEYSARELWWPCRIFTIGKHIFISLIDSATLSKLWDIRFQKCKDIALDN